MTADAPATTVGRARRAKARPTRHGVLFALPFIIGFVAFSAVPILLTLYYSFTSFNLFQDPSWVGLDNYTKLADDAKFWLSLGNTAYMTAIGVPLTIVLALGGALILNLPVRGQPLFRALVYVPVLVPVVVGGYLFRWIMNAQYGFLNQVLRTVGLPAPNWLESPDWGKPAIILLCMWGIGGTTLIYLAALKEVPAELHEAAALDGAGPILRFVHVTLPSISSVTLFQVVVTIIAFLQIFTQPYIMAQDRAVTGGSVGGPADSMLSYTVYLFQSAFTFLKMGQASAMAWILFLITLAITAVVFLSSRRWVHSGDD